MLMGSFYRLIELENTMKRSIIINHHSLLRVLVIADSEFQHMDVLCATLCLFFTDCFVLMLVCFLPHDPDGDY